MAVFISIENHYGKDMEVFKCDTCKVKYEATAKNIGRINLNSITCAPCACDKAVVGFTKQWHAEHLRSLPEKEAQLKKLGRWRDAKW